MNRSLLIGFVSSIMASWSLQGATDCVKLTLSVRASAAAEPSKVLELVSSQVAASPGCACEIVKAAIEGSKAKPDGVAAIVEVAITAAPEQIRIIAQCAVAVAPDSLAKVQAVLAKHDPQGDELAASAKDGQSHRSAKDAKSPAGEVASMFNPLDFPGQGPIGPIDGGPGGQPLIPLFPPIIINPPEVSNVNG